MSKAWTISTMIKTAIERLRSMCRACISGDSVGLNQTRHKIYIAGKMSGEHCFNFERFFYWAHLLRGRNWEPINPAEIDCLKMLKGWRYRKWKYNSILRQDLRLIREEAHAIFMLKGWENSPGACQEYELARDLDLMIIYEKDYI